MKFSAQIAALSAVAIAASPATAAEHATMSPAAQETLKTYIAADARPAKQKARDQYRRPFETLDFCGVEPEMIVVEIWPGGQGGWYRKILEPFITENGGQYHPVRSRSGFPAEKLADIPYDEADMVLVFRAHGFMIYKEPAQTHVNEVFSMLKPGGTLCIVDHAGDEAIPQDPKGENGYVNESHFEMLAEKAGFVQVAKSEHNRNPKDTKDYPRGVWSLPPTLSGSMPMSKERKKYLEIGESDRFTHKYVKPAAQ